MTYIDLFSVFLYRVSFDEGDFGDILEFLLISTWEVI